MNDIEAEHLRKAVLPFGDAWPQIADGAFIAPGAVVIGKVEVGVKSSIWYNSVVRGDEEPITIGAGTNIQDGSVVHTSGGRAGVWIGDDVLIGHMCCIHGCRLENRAFVGMGAIILDHAVIEEDGMLAAGSLLTPGKRIPKGELWAGRPAAFMRELSGDDLANNARAVEEYIRLALAHTSTLKGGNRKNFENKY